MQKGISNDVILYAYEELPIDRVEEVRQQIFSNPSLEEEFFNILNTKQQLDGVAEKSKKPSNQSIEQILAFSRKSNRVLVNSNS